MNSFRGTNLAMLSVFIKYFPFQLRGSRLQPCLRGMDLRRLPGFACFRKKIAACSCLGGFLPTDLENMLTMY
jgi:hypothetical protein